jgi:hypothetical protein
VEETIRVLEAFQFHEANGEVCPANWRPGEGTIVADPVGAQTYFATAYAKNSGKRGTLKRIAIKNENPGVPVLAGTVK